MRKSYGMQEAIQECHLVAEAKPDADDTSAKELSKHFVQNGCASAILALNFKVSLYFIVAQAMCCEYMRV